MSDSINPLSAIELGSINGLPVVPGGVTAAVPACPSLAVALPVADGGRPESAGGVASGEAPPGGEVATPRTGFPVPGPNPVVNAAPESNPLSPLRFRANGSDGGESVVPLAEPEATAWAGSSVAPPLPSGLPTALREADPGPAAPLAGASSNGAVAPSAVEADAVSLSVLCAGALVPRCAWTMAIEPSTITPANADIRMRRRFMGRFSRKTKVTPRTRRRQHVGRRHPLPQDVLARTSRRSTARWK